MGRYKLPSVSGGSTEKAVDELRRYLFQLVQDLNAADQAAERATTVLERQVNAAGARSSPAPQATFTSIKDLIIKSADIVGAYGDKIEKTLRGKYVAMSGFGAYRQETQAQLDANAERVELAFRNQQEIQTGVAALNASLLEVRACIRTGNLTADADGVPVYGVEIGQQNVVDGVVTFKKYARLTADRLSFFDANDVEVAWISDEQLHVTTAEVGHLKAAAIETPEIRLGGYVMAVGSDGHLSIQ